MTINYDSPRELRAFLEERGLGMRKKFGQNFLVNPRVRTKLIEALEIKNEETILEAGPGLGAMTKGLLGCSARLFAFEIDPAFSNILREQFGGNQNFTLIEGDILKTWPAARDKLEGGLPCFFGNLPYNIGAALLADFIEKGCLFPRMVVTLQKETARRMVAAPGSKDYSSFSVLCASAYRIKPLMIIKGQSFFPVPRVDSQGLRLDLLRKEERVVHLPLFQPLVRGLFSSRRKTIKNNLINFASSLIMVGKGEDAAQKALESAGLSGERRAETLSVRDFGMLAEALERIRKDGI